MPRALRFRVGLRSAELILDARTLESFESFLLILEFAANFRGYPQRVGNPDFFLYRKLINGTINTKWIISDMSVM